MFDREDPKNIWVSPESIDGSGSYDRPYSSLKEALDQVQPGNTIILKNGSYTGDVTIQVSGSARAPIRILPDDGATVEIHNSCWFFYDTSDFVVSGFTFRNAPSGAISIIGECKRNRFDSLQFIDCGSRKDASCTMFFGGSGGEFNVVDNCRFQRSADNENKLSSPENASIGLMISQGDGDDSKRLRNCIFRQNHFINYGYGIMVGSGDSNDSQYGHVVEYNTVENCISEGIVVKCGDTQIRGNLVMNCPGKSITVLAGTGSMIEDNRILDCGSGIAVNGQGHTISNNCLIRCGREAVRVCAKSNGNSSPASSLFIESNTFIECGSAATEAKPRVAGITIEPGTTCAVRRNLVYGEGEVFYIVKSISYRDNLENIEISTPAQYVIQDNAASGQCREAEGFSTIAVEFSTPESGNYENQSGYGASGWMMRSEGFDPHMDDIAEEDDYLDPDSFEDDDGELIIPGETNQSDLFSRYFEMDESQTIADEG
ncbi:MAG: hypothetical protein GX556_15900 [Fibrobacter sp.]|nr:hypothetical protein [Fibrobacter sp.]